MLPAISVDKRCYSHPDGEPWSSGEKQDARHLAVCRCHHPLTVHPEGTQDAKAQDPGPR